MSACVTFSFTSGVHRTIGSSDKNSLFLGRRIGKFALCVKKKRLQDILVLGYSLARMIGKDASPIELLLY